MFVEVTLGTLEERGGFEDQRLTYKWRAIVRRSEQCSSRLHLGVVAAVDDSGLAVEARGLVRLGLAWQREACGSYWGIVIGSIQK